MFYIHAGVLSDLFGTEKKQNNQRLGFFFFKQRVQRNYLIYRLDVYCLCSSDKKKKILYLNKTTWIKAVKLWTTETSVSF